MKESVFSYWNLVFVFVYWIRIEIKSVEKLECVWLQRGKYAKQLTPLTWFDTIRYGICHTIKIPSLANEKVLEIAFHDFGISTKYGWKEISGKLMHTRKYEEAFDGALISSYFQFAFRFYKLLER